MAADPLHRRWRALCVAAGATDAAAIDDALEAALARYAEPHRRYPTAEHVHEVLQTIDALADPRDPGATCPLASPDDHLAVCLAAWLHDVVSDPTAATNEHDSAAWATAALTGLGVRPSLVQETARLIELTATHQPAPGDDNGMVLCDADLAILAARRARYDRYAAAVRAEYAHVDDEAFRLGRSAVLRRFLERPSIYWCSLMVQRCDAPARANLRRELDALNADHA
jgi:predicted metal-dependent HD superfamily phosphohydrolase